MRTIYPLPHELWFEVARRCPTATFFHTPLWHTLIAKALPPCRDASVGVELPDGIRAVLPLIELGRPMKGVFAELESSFAGCYGGLISDQPLSEERRREALLAALRPHRLARLHLTGNPLEGGAHAGLESAESRQDSTQMVALDSAGGVETRFSATHRRAIRKAETAGVTVARASSLEEYAAYHEVYEDARQRWGDRATSSYPRALFEAGWRLSQEHPGRMTLWLASHGGRLAAGAWVFTWNRHAVFWHGASRTDSLDVHPSHLLHAAIMRHLRSEGFSWYDFNPSGGHEGVDDFKRRFGSSRHPITRYTLTGRLFKGARRLAAGLKD